MNLCKFSLWQRGALQAAARQTQQARTAGHQGDLDGDVADEKWWSPASEASVRAHRALAVTVDEICDNAGQAQHHAGGQRRAARRLNMSPQPPDHSGRIRNASLDKPLAADAGYASETPSRGGATDISGLELGSVVQEGLPVAFFVTAASTRANAMRAVPDAPRGKQDRRMAQDSIFADLLSATVCGLVIVVAVFGAHWLVVLSSSHQKHKSHHHWTGTDSVSNDVRLEVEKKWLGGQKTLPTGAILHEGRHAHGLIDAISAQQFKDAVERLHRKASREGAASSRERLHGQEERSSSLLVPIDDIGGSSSRSGSVGLNHIPQSGGAQGGRGGGRAEEDDGGIWVPRTDPALRRADPPGRARDAHLEPRPLSQSSRPLERTAAALDGLGWGDAGAIGVGGNSQAGLASTH